MMKWFLLGCLLASSPVWAINKCRLADGQLVYQEAACPTAAKESSTVKTWGAGSGIGYSGRSGRWEFVHRKDEMTGRVSCAAWSDAESFFAQPGAIAHQRLVSVQVVVLFEAKAETFALRLDDERDRFDRNVSGMGVKTSTGGFVPLSEASSTVATVANSAGILAEMEKSGNLQARVRIWPWDRLHDVRPFKMTGFQEAMKKGRSCAERLAAAG